MVPKGFVSCQALCSGAPKNDTQAPDMFLTGIQMEHQILWNLLRQLKDIEASHEGKGWELSFACVFGQFYPGSHVVHSLADYRRWNLAATNASRVTPAEEVARLALNPLNDESGMTTYTQDAIFKK